MQCQAEGADLVDRNKYSDGSRGFVHRESMLRWTILLTAGIAVAAVYTLIGHTIEMIQEARGEQLQTMLAEQHVTASAPVLFGCRKRT